MHLLGQVDPNTQAAHVDVGQTGGQFQRQSSVIRIHLRENIQDNLTAGGHGTDGALPQQLNTLDMGHDGHTCGGEHRTDGVLSQPGQHELGTHGVSHFNWEHMVLVMFRPAAVSLEQMMFPHSLVVPWQQAV